MEIKLSWREYYGVPTKHKAVVLSWDWTPKPVVYRRATEAEKSTCPASFRCFECGQKRPRSRLGGMRVNERICYGCYPLSDDRQVAGLISWEKRHGTYRGVNGDEKPSPFRKPPERIIPLSPRTLELIERLKEMEKK